MSRKAKGCEAKFGRAHLSQDFTFVPWHNVKQKQKIIILTSFSWKVHLENMFQQISDHFGPKNKNRKFWNFSKIF